MKNKILFLSGITLLLSCLVLAGSATYKITFMVGQAWVKKASSPKWKALKINDQVALGDSVKVDSESRVELLAADQAVIKLGAAFRDRLTPGLMATLSPRDPEASTLSKLVRSKAEMKPTTPTAVAAIRGKAAAEETEFLSEEELTSLLQEETPAPAGVEATDPFSTQENARVLLEEAIRLREQVDKLLKEDKLPAALATLSMSQKLTQQALNLLGN